MTTVREALNNEISRYYALNNLTENGVQFVCHLVKEQKLRYLHKVFPQTQSLGSPTFISHFGFEPARDYRDFFSDFGGVVLFDNCFHIFGYDADLSRGLNIGDQKPVYIGIMQDEFSINNPNLFERGWRIVGSLSLDIVHPVLIDCNGRCAIIINDGLKVFSSFSECVCTVISFLAEKMGCNLLSVELAEEIDKDLLAIATNL